MQHFGKAALRITKNYTKGYSDTQAKVRDATSNDPWGPSGTQMNEIAQLTYNQYVAVTVPRPLQTLIACPLNHPSLTQKRLYRDHGNAR